MQLTSLILIEIGLTAFVSADCCKPVTRSEQYGQQYYDEGRCRDRTFRTPCCGYGPCNIFCCNCVGGCRVFGRYPPKEKRDDNTSAATTPDNLFQTVDQNNNAEISLSEYIAWVSDSQGQDVASNATLLNMWIEKFNLHDVNKDGKVSEAEIENPSA